MVLIEKTENNGVGLKGKSIYLDLICTESEMLVIPLSGNIE